MVTATVRERLHELRRPARAARLARVLWVAWAVVVWNVVFDHELVVAGRRYLHAAALAAQAGEAYARIDDWMRPAVARGLWVASAWAAVILLTGLFGVRITTASAPHRRRVGAAGGA